MPIDTEARYAEIAREMVASGNYLEPTFNGIKHFHKPPLAYWLIAAGMKIFGPNNFGARFFSVLAAAIAVAALFHTGRLILGDRERALTAATIGASSFLFLAVARLASTEIYLACFTLLAQFFLFRQIYGPKSLVNALGYALFLALGFITKGPVIFLFTLCPFLLAKGVDPAHRQVFSRREMWAAILLFAMVACPWYLAVIARNHGLLEYFVQVQTIDRVITDRFRRYEPPWYFLQVFALTFLPYSFFFLQGAWQVRALPQRTRIQFIYLLLPFLVFSLATGKHATYILPLFGSAAMITADALALLAGRRLPILSVVLLVPLALAPLAAALFWPPLAGRGLPVALFTPAAVLLLWQVNRARGGAAFVPWTAAFLVLFAAAAASVQAIADTRFKGYQRMVAAINRLDPEHRTPVLVYNAFLPSISFYRGELATMALGETREVQFETTAAYRESYLQTDPEVAAFIKGKNRLFVVLEPAKLPRLQRVAPVLVCREIFSQRKHSAYLCEEGRP